MSDLVIIVLFSMISILYLYSTHEIKKRTELEIERLKSEKLDPKILELLLKDKSFENINKLLDDIIEKYVNDYTILVLSKDTNNYLNSSQIEDIEEYVTGSVLKNISSSVIYLLGLIYKLNTEKEISSFIKVRCKIYLIGFISQYNSIEK